MIRQMATPEFLQKLGVFTLRNFFEPQQCAELYTEMLTASNQKGTVGHQQTSEGTGIVDEGLRKVLHTDLRASTESYVRSRIEDLTPALEKHFEMNLTGCTGPHFLRYQPGGFYTPHRDRSPGAPSNIAARRVSVVIFLNSVSAEPSPGCYGGGALRFLGLLSGPRWENCALALDAEPGLLVAFDSTVLHEVLPVTFGERMTIVAWLTGP